MANNLSLKRPACLAVVLVLVSVGNSLGAEGRFLVPYVTGRPELRPFTGFLGWVDAYGRGYGQRASARIEKDGTFRLPDDLKQPVCLIAMFDKMETPPLVFPQWPEEAGGRELVIPTEYACVPDGYPAGWEGYGVRATFFAQTFVPRCTQLYGWSVFEGPKISPTGNQIHAFVHEGGPDTEPLFINQKESPDPGMAGRWDMLTGGITEEGLGRVGWRHGEMQVTPGKTYALRFYGYKSPGKGYETLAYIRPDAGDGYAGGNAFARAGKPVEGDLCCLVFGNSHGQLVENQVRGEEWEVFLPAVRPTQDFGQTFLSHGTSIAGVSFWASGGREKDVECEVQLFEEGPWGKRLGPAKVAKGHVSPDRPVIRYPDVPARLKGYEEYYTLPCLLFQVAWFPDEIKVEPGKTYYIRVGASKPLMMYADGDYYHDGYSYYDELKVDRQAAGRRTLHSRRWTFAMNIVTFSQETGIRVREGG